MAIFKKIISWLFRLFTRGAVEDIVDVVEDQTGIDIPDEGILDFASKILPSIVGEENAKLWDRQEHILSEMDKGNVLIDGDRQTGKSLLLTIYAIYKLFTKPKTVVYLRTDSKQSGEQLLSKIVGIIDNIKEEFGVSKVKWLKTSLELSNGSKIILSRSSDLKDIKPDFDILIGDEVAFWETKALEALIKKFPKHKGKIHLVTSQWDDKVNKIVDAAPEAINVINLLFFDKDKDLGQKARNLIKVLGKEGFLKEFGALFR